MSETPSGTTQAVTPESTPPALTATTTTPDPQAGDGSEQISLDEARKLRRENQTLRQRQKAIDEAEEAKQQAAMSDLDKVSKRAEAAEARIQEYQAKVTQYEVRLAAQAMNIVDPELAALAIHAKLEYGDDGMPTNIEKTLKDLIKNKPYLVQAESPPVTPARTAPVIPAMNPGRSSIQSPSGTQQGSIPRLSDVYTRP